VFKQVPDNRQDAVPNSHECSLLTASRGHMVELAVEIRVFGVRNRVRCLDER
jgi:hypothetical protein